jgi:hypothetical protein
MGETGSIVIRLEDATMEGVIGKGTATKASGEERSGVPRVFCASIFWKAVTVAMACTVACALAVAIALFCASVVAVACCCAVFVA